MNDNMHEIILQDPETGQMYQLFLTTVDFLEASKDQEFAHTLLRHAKATAGSIVCNATESDEGIKCPSESIDDAGTIQNINSTDKSSSKVYYVWKHEQVLALIDAMSNYFPDLDNPKKRKDVFELISNDLLSSKYNVNATIVQNKWKSLVKSYRKAKDCKNKTGQGPSRFNFYDAMDALLGKDPSNACSHAINSICEDEMTSTTHGEESELEEPSTSLENIESTKKVRKVCDKQLKRQYVEMKSAEYKKREERHAEKMEMENRKLVLLETFLKLKEGNK